MLSLDNFFQIFNKESPVQLEVNLVKKKLKILCQEETFLLSLHIPQIKEYSYI